VLCSTSLVVVFVIWSCRAAEGVFRGSLRSSSRIGVEVEVKEDIPWEVGENVRDEVPVPVRLHPSNLVQLSDMLQESVWCFLFTPSASGAFS
jgi:hypothetical protein